MSEGNSLIFRAIWYHNIVALDYSSLNPSLLIPPSGVSRAVYSVRAKVSFIGIWFKNWTSLYSQGLRKLFDYGSTTGDITLDVQ